MHDIFFSCRCDAYRYRPAYDYGKGFDLHTLHCADKCNSRKAGKRTYIFPWRKAYPLSSGCEVCRWRQKLYRKGVFQNLSENEISDWFRNSNLLQPQKPWKNAICRASVSSTDRIGVSFYRCCFDLVLFSLNPNKTIYIISFYPAKCRKEKRSDSLRKDGY